jgi:hypothetical protein
VICSLVLNPLYPMLIAALAQLAECKSPSADQMELQRMVVKFGPETAAVYLARQYGIQGLIERSECE